MMPKQNATTGFSIVWAITRALSHRFLYFQSQKSNIHRLKTIHKPAIQFTMEKKGSAANAPIAPRREGVLPVGWANKSSVVLVQTLFLRTRQGRQSQIGQRRVFYVFLHRALFRDSFSYRGNFTLLYYSCKFNGDNGIQYVGTTVCSLITRDPLLGAGGGWNTNETKTKRDLLLCSFSEQET